MSKLIMGVVLLLTLTVFQDAFANSPTRPLVFIPGILGSTLVDSSGKVVWGDWRSLTNLETLTIPDGPVDPHDGITASGPIQSVMKIGPWSVKQYGSLTRYLESLGYRKGENYFEFAYDWRQSNFTSAEQFAKYVENTKGLAGGEFDVLAHSMGGLIAQIYAKTMDKGKLVRKIVNMGVPFNGSVNTMAMLTEGWGGAQNFMAGGISTIRAFSLSIPSFYELLPLYQNCCIDGPPSSEEKQPYNVLLPEKWSLVKWLPDETENTRRRQVEEALMKARNLRALADTAYPNHTHVFYIVGGRIDTYNQFYIDSTKRELIKYNTGQGDGTVIEGSAAGGSDINASQVSLTKHSTIFDEDHIRTYLKRVLIDVSPFPETYNSSDYSITASDRNVIPVRSLSFDANPSLVKAGDECELKFSITADAGTSVDKVNFQIMTDGNLQPTVMSSAVKLDNASPLAWKATYTTKVKAQDEPGIQTFILKVDGLPNIEEYLVVIHKEG